MHHLIWSVATIAASLCFAALVRVLVAAKMKTMSIQALCDEFIGNFVCAVTMMELSVLSFAQYNGYIQYTCLYVFLFFKILYFSSMELYSTPLSFIDLYYSKNRKHEFAVSEVLLIIITQSIAALFGQTFAKFVWLYQDALHQNAADERCLSTMSDIHDWHECFSVEFIGTFICALVDFIMLNKLKPFSRPLMIIIVIHYFGHITGMWMNPMLATVFTFRCHGHYSDFLHFTVYWIAPFVGLLLAWEIHFLAKKYLMPTQTETKKKKIQ